MEGQEGSRTRSKEHQRVREDHPATAPPAAAASTQHEDPRCALAARHSPSSLYVRVRMCERVRVSRIQ
jgi:hypothetical protein